MKHLLALIAVAMVFLTDGYSKVYWICVAIYWVLGIVDDADECNLPWYDDWDDKDDE